MNIASIFGIMGAFAAIFTFLTHAYLCSSIIFPRAAIGSRFCSTIVLGFWSQGVIFYVLLYGEIFTPLAAYLSLAVLGTFSAFLASQYRENISRCFAYDIEKLTDIKRISFGPKIRWITAPSLLLITAHFLRSMNAPPLAWDDLTYHLVKATLWVKEGEFASYGAPGAWEYYLYFLPLGDAPSAWGLLLTRTDTVIAIIGLGQWLLLFGTIYFLARQLNATSVRAYMAAWGAGLVPAIANHIFNGYVDNLVALLQGAALVLLIDMFRHKRAASGVIAMIALGTSVAVKQTGAFTFLFGAALFTWALVKLDLRHKLLTVALGATGICLILIPPLVFNWSQTGSPTYPFALTLGSIEIFAGSAEQQWYFDNAERWRSRLGYLKGIFIGGCWETIRIHNNFGPGSFIIILAAIFGFKSLSSDKGKVPLFAGALLVWAFVLVMLLVETSSLSGCNRGRFFVISIVLFTVVFASVNRSWTTWVLGLFWITNLLLFFPFNWAKIEALSVVILLILALPFVAIGALTTYYLRNHSLRNGRFLSILTAPLLLAIFIVTCVLPMRDMFRYTIYDHAGVGNSYSHVPLIGHYGQGGTSAPLWASVDQPNDSFRIAVTAGWDGRGHNWFVYPYFGSRLQNEIQFIPISESGALVSPRNIRTRVETADYDAWLDRLRQENIDYVATFAPMPYEAVMMGRDETRFELIEAAEPMGNFLFRFKDEESSPNNRP